METFRFSKKLFGFENKNKLSNVKLDCGINRVSFSQFSDSILFNNTVNLHLLKVDFEFRQSLFTSVNLDWDIIALQGDLFRSPMTKNLSLITQLNGELLIKDL